MTRLLLPLLVLTGLTGCKGTLHDRFVVELNPTQTDEDLLGVAICLDPYPVEVEGVTTWKRTTAGPGLVVQRVLKESPADQVGIEAGDLLLRYGAHTLHSPADLRSAMRALSELRAYDGKVEVTVLRGPREHVLPVRPGSSRTYWSHASSRLAEATAEVASSVHLPFLFQYQRLEVPVEAYLDYTGRVLQEPMVLYTDFDLMPVLNTFSLFRIETAPGIDDGWRFQTLTWPLTFKGSGDGASYRRELLAAGEDRYEVF